ncbi:MAG: DNA-3-methyladenine glycosylase 2 family protein [Acidobacteria bacterium]|nr:DNA-3-methyladenine glycosylase 2 family protein [Acidobacteriota bacterium]
MRLRKWEAGFLVHCPPSVNRRKLWYSAARKFSEGDFSILSKLDSFVEELTKAERTLARRDKRLGAFIKRYGACAIRPHTRYFHTLVGSIISQQLSTKAADTIHKRFLALYTPTRTPRPEQILATPDDALRACGMSFSKISYIKDIAAKTGDGTLKFNRLSKMTDDEIIAMLTQVKGIGVWTVHMFLIFSLGRMDVLPVGDLGVRRGIQLAYGFDQLPNAEEIERVATENGWRPYCSVASWYLWRSLENKD